MVQWKRPKSFPPGLDLRMSKISAYPSWLFPSLGIGPALLVNMSPVSSCQIVRRWNLVRLPVPDMFLLSLSSGYPGPLQVFAGPETCLHLDQLCPTSVWPWSLVRSALTSALLSTQPRCLQASTSVLLFLRHKSFLLFSDTFSSKWHLTSSPLYHFFPPFY